MRNVFLMLITVMVLAIAAEDSVSNVETAEQPSHMEKQLTEQEQIEQLQDEMKLEKHKNYLYSKDATLKLNAEALSFILAMAGILIAMLAVEIAFIGIIGFIDRRKYLKELDNLKKKAKKRVKKLVKDIEKNKKKSDKLVKFEDQLSSDNDELQKNVEEIEDDFYASKYETDLAKATKDYLSDDYESALKGYYSILNDHRKEEKMNPSHINFRIAYCYSDQARFSKVLSKKKELLKQAQNTYEKVLTRKNFEKALVYNNLGGTLLNLALWENDNDEKRRLLNESKEKCEKALELDSKESGVYINLGSILLYSSKWERNGEKKRLLNESKEMNMIAVYLNPESLIAYRHLGKTLVKLAKLEPEKKESLLNQTKIEFQRAIDLSKIQLKVKKEKKYQLSAHHNCGLALMGLEKLEDTNKDKKINLLNEAEESFFKSQKLDGRYYDLARVYAKKYAVNKEQADKKQAFDYLEKILSEKELTFYYIEQESDFDSLKDDPEYEKFKDK